MHSGRIRTTAWPRRRTAAGNTLIFNGIYDRPNDLPMALMMAYLAAESYPRFAFTRKKSDLVVAILTTIAAAVALAAYVVSVVRGV